MFLDVITCHARYGHSTVCLDLILI